uniref:Uncharacterized protein n=1 Tax=Anguilla anguilla TaxID=7936 RepID=A0A0E9Q0J3_ANGAN
MRNYLFFFHFIIYLSATQLVLAVEFMQFIQ